MVLNSKKRDTSSSAKTEVYLIRHAQPKSHFVNGNLTDVGYTQATKLAKRIRSILSAVKPLIIVSPTLRTRQTAAPICSIFGVRQIVHSAFNEEYLVDSRALFLSPEFFRHHVASRKILSAFWHIVHSNRGKKIIIVTHGNVIRAILRKLLKKSFVDVCKMKVECSSVTKIEIDGKNVTLLS
jgi:broad specificity phosphatase PhoE